MPDGSRIPVTTGKMHRPGVAHDGTAGRPSDEDLARSVEIDMERIVGIAREHGIPIIWYNYPWPRSFPVVLHTIDKTAARLGVPVLDARKDYARATADGYQLEDLADMSAGLHPTGILFGYIAKSMLVLIQEVVKERYGIEMVAAPATSTAAGS
jgi:hypothetical protein